MNDVDENKNKKKSYNKPTINSEKLLSYGALCNGKSVGGRKSTAGAPDFCNAGKLLS